MGDTFLNQFLVNREVKDVAVVNSLACDGHGIEGVKYSWCG